MNGRVSTHGDGVRMRLRSWELALLHRLRDELVALLRDGGADDPAVSRLFPPAVEDDDEADGELRALIGSELLTERLEALEEMLEILDRAEASEEAPAPGDPGTSGPGELLVVDLAGEEAALVLGVLNDVRLALGARAGIEDLDREELSEDDPVAPTVAVMDHLAGMQEQLLGVLDPAALKFYDDLASPPDDDVASSSDDD